MEEEYEIDINEAEPAFLKGQSSRSGVEVSPIKIVKNPDGSMQVRGQLLTAHERDEHPPYARASVTIHVVVRCLSPGESVQFEVVLGIPER